jgi:hypothetical protein
MTNSDLGAFTSVWVIDTEFRQKDGERNEPVCLCALEVRTGRRLELFFDRHHDNPFDYSDTLFVCYVASAEWKTFISLGWSLPPNVVDLYFEHLNTVNGLWYDNCNLRLTTTGLADAMAFYGLDGLSCVEKQEERDFILSRTSYPPEAQRHILSYCWKDVEGTAMLLGEMSAELDLDQALLRGAYSRSVAWMEHNGLPVSPLYREVDEHRQALQVEIARKVEDAHGYGVFEIQGRTRPTPVFKQRRFDALVERSGLTDVWPTTPRGHYSTRDKDVFRPMAKLHPELEPLRQARKSIKSLGLFGAAIGTDCRNRAPVHPFGTVTSRNNYKAAQFALSRPHWVRNLIAPPEGHALVYGDIVAAEAGIAADASGDPELIRIYNSGLDPYIEFAKSAGALPPDTFRDEKNRPDIEAMRDLYKVADLGTKYGIGGASLATNLGAPAWQADLIIAEHKRTYAAYWAWAYAQIERAYQAGYIETAFGWRMVVERMTKRNTILNFPQQATCAELMRLTCILLEERGLGPMLCATHHDAFYLECPEELADQVSAELQSCFQDAAGVVLSGRVALRLNLGVVHTGGQYADKKGTEIWSIVKDFLKQ